MKEINIYNIFHLPFINNKNYFQNENLSFRSRNNNTKIKRDIAHSFSFRLNNLSNIKRKKLHFNSFLLENNSKIPSSNKKVINISKNKSIINTLKLNEINPISKLSLYNMNKFKINNYIHNKLNLNLKLKENKSVSNLLKSKNIEEKINYCFLNYAYNEYQNLFYRKAMEDFHCIKKTLLKNNKNRIIYSYFAIFDGHAGKEVSQYLSQNFHQILSSQLKMIKKMNINEIILALKLSFLFADMQIIKDPSFTNKIGSTGTVVLLVDFGISLSTKYIICANVGDSKGYILSNKKLIPITKCHNCYNVDETLRIKKSGGIIFNNRVYGILMLTRSFGDKEMKKHGVIAKPDIICKKISENDIFIIIASDGVWDTVDENDIITMGDFNLSSDELSKRIVKLAIEKGTMDNVSCIVIKLNESK